MENLKAGEKAILDKRMVVDVVAKFPNGAVVNTKLYGTQDIKTNSRLTSCFTVRILDNGNALWVSNCKGCNDLGVYHCAYPDECGAIECVELPYRWKDPKKHEPMFCNYYAYRDNDHFVLIEPVTHQPNT